MSALSAFLSRVWSIILSVLAVLRKLICRFRRRKNSGSVLPMTTPHINTTDLHQSVPSNDTSELQSWDSWDTSFGTNSRANGKAEKIYSTRLPPPEPEPEPDFFGDMTPELKKTPKIIVKKKDHYRPGTISSRLAMSADETPAVSNELTAWEEGGNSWGDEVTEDLTWEADEAIRETKRQERQQRHLEQQRRKLEREAKRNRKDSGSLAAVKLS